ncbi:MAG: hypothetical protein WAU24_13030 [Chitinophagaceae bacterium]
MKNREKLNEPIPKYGKENIQHFSSFEEMNEADAKSAADIHPLEHLKNTVDLIKGIYSEELKKPFDKKIKFM